MHANEEGMLDVGHKDVAFGHDVFCLVLPQNVRLVKHFHCIQSPLRLVSRQKYLRRPPDGSVQLPCHDRSNSRMCVSLVRLASYEN